jgi:hypothetical protein
MRLRIPMILALFFLSTLPAIAEPANGKPWTLGPEVYFHHYEEPDVMQNEGVFYGLAGSYIYTLPRNWLFTAEARFAMADVDYDSIRTGSSEGNDDAVFETRGLLGYTIPQTIVTPFFGIAYRYLNDDSAGVRTTTGHVGYERESNYFYSPVGLSVIRDLGNNWSVGFSAEYDIFWAGRQNSNLSTASTVFNDITNHQDSGHGARASLHIEKRGRWDFIFKPFVRWWQVDDSDLDAITVSGVVDAYGYEPENHTWEAGAELGVKF